MVAGNREIKAIGGYFELADNEGVHAIPVSGVLLNTGRNALEYILRSLPNIKEIWIPYYTCEVVLEPIQKLQIPYQFYHINESLELKEKPKLGEGAYLIVNNYFGLQDAYIKKLASIYKDKLIVDNAQALFSPAMVGIKALYSCRKFVGVCDGGIAIGVPECSALTLDFEDSASHNEHLLIRKAQGAEAGFATYQENEIKLDNQPIRRMSAYTQDILTHIDYEKIKHRRKQNFAFLHQALGSSNKWNIPSDSSYACPMVYPYMYDNVPALRQKLIANKVFVAKYWPNVAAWSKPDSLETWLANHILPLPIDQRYDEKDMERIIQLILS